MILYFSGTGNSEYAASRIGKNLNEEVINLFEKIRNHDFSEMYSATPWIIAAPTYSWRIPRILENWLKHTTLSGCKEIYFVMTCGSNIGNAGKYLEKLCISKNMNYSGCFQIVMPENYVAMFSTPTKEQALKIIRQTDNRIDEAASFIKNKKAFPQRPLSIIDRIESGIVNDAFYPIFVHAKKFYAKDTCISCKKCADVCPLDNIHIVNKKPVWGKNCTHCMACICRCPSEAIEYGKRSEGKPRYTCPK